MRSFFGSDSKFYSNDLCLDTSNGDTIASLDIKKLKMNEKELALINQWESVISWAKQTDNYNPQLTYGVYQIFAELNTFYKDENTNKKVWHNV